MANNHSQSRVDSGVPRRDLVVVGASAGGVSALRSLVAQLPPDLPASVLVVTHTTRGRESRLAAVLGRAGGISVALAEHGVAIEREKMYVAPPDRHLLVFDGHMHLSRGPRENMTRPAIDPLFRSAAVHFRSRVIGIVLSGTLDDGTAGLSAIKACGGIAVVQDPADALFADMPRSALEHVAVDHCLPVGEMGSLLSRLVAEAAPDAPEPPYDLVVEEQATRVVLPGASEEEMLGTPVSISCPECGGPMWWLGDTAGDRYRCQVGHSFTARTLEESQGHAAERSLWNAVIYLEEHARVLERMARSQSARGREANAARFRDRAAEARHHVDRVRDVILTIGKTETVDADGSRPLDD